MASHILLVVKSGQIKFPLLSCMLATGLTQAFLLHFWSLLHSLCSIASRSNELSICGSRGLALAGGYNLSEQLSLLTLSVSTESYTESPPPTTLSRQDLCPCSCLSFPWSSSSLFTTHSLYDWIQLEDSSQNLLYLCWLLDLGVRN